MSKLNPAQLEATKAECFLDSSEKLDIHSKMVRTEGVDQVPHWYNDQPIGGNWIREREYWCGIYKDKPYFAKRILDLPEPHVTREFVEYHVEGLIILADLRFVPNLLFWSDDTIGMDFCTGKTIKELWYEGKWDMPTAELLMCVMFSMLGEIRSRLWVYKRIYDLSWNNIMIDGTNIYIVDFDPSDRYVPMVDIMEILIRLAKGKLGFNDKGELIDL